MALTDNLLAYYKLDGNSNDSVGSNNGTDTSISYVSAKINDGASATNGLITNSSSSFKIDTMSASIWVKSAGFGASYRLLVTSQQKWSLFANDNVLGSYDWGAVTFRSTGVNIADGNWHHCVLTYDSGVTNGSKIYVDGSLSLTFTCTSSGVASNFKMLADSVSSQNASCTLDEVGIWTRLLSAGEVTQLYNSGAGLAYPFSAVSQNSNFFLSM